jgi:LacI family transcriptional regulator
MPGKKISIHDIARHLNISSATVSFVLNGKAVEKRISSALEKKILKYVQKSGYRPNRVAKSLRTGKSRIIGMLVEGISDPFFSSIARIIEERALHYDYKIFYSSTNNDAAITKEIIKVYRDTQVDGYIIAPPPGIEEDIRGLMEDDFPVVLFDRYFPDLTTHNVVVDNFSGSYQAIEHFLQNGYRNIGFVTLNSQQTQMTDRLDGYTKAIKENKLGKYLLKIPFGTAHGLAAEKVKSFLQRNPNLDAVLFATNYLAISGLEAIDDLKLCIPEDIGVVGFDDNTHFGLFSPTITAIAQPVQAISEAAIRKLMDCLSGKEKDLPKETTVLPVKLIVRESSVPIRIGQLRSL